MRSSSLLSPKLLLPLATMLGLSVAVLGAGRKAPKSPSSPSATPSPAADAPAGSAHLRIWKGELPSKRSLRVTVKSSGKKPVSTELKTLQNGYQFTEYVPVPAEDLLLEIFDAAPDGAKLTSLPVHLLGDSSATLLLNEIDGEISAEILLDGVRTSKSKTAELAVRNFVPTLTSLQVTIGDDIKVGLRSAESFLELRGLKRDILQIDTAGQQEPGKPLRWTNEVDFSRVRKATLLIYPDSYGRIRPRLVVDGETGNQGDIPARDTAP